MAAGARERLCWLRLIRTDNVGPATFRRLLQRYGTAERALSALPDLAARGGQQKFAPFSAAAAQEELEKIEAAGARLILSCDPEYPPLLGEIDDAPPAITVLGDASLLSKPSLGVVGSRNASLAGRRLAGELSRGVAAAGYGVVSGLARGIDAAAHEAALEQPGRTVAVVAGGIDVIYPPENRALYGRIAAGGAIVAESPMGMEPIARHFPRRNRIISGLARGVLVVEAAEKSGSLITARMALEQNREVFAVPGSPLDPRAGGTNSLLRDGAHFATSVADICRVLDSLRLVPLRETAAGYDAPPPAGSLSDDRVPDDRLRARVIEALGYAPVQMDELIRSLGAPAGDVMTVVLELEIAGRVERHAGNKVSLL